MLHAGKEYAMATQWKVYKEWEVYKEKHFDFRKRGSKRDRPCKFRHKATKHVDKYAHLYAEVEVKH